MSHNTTTTKVRESNFELLRLVAMFMILAIHANYKVFGKVTPDEAITAPLLSYLRIFLDQSCVIAVNVFVLISGWYGIKCKLSGILNILFMAMFYSVIALGLAKVLSIGIDAKTLFSEVYFGYGYWFVPHYLGLYVLAPLINKFIEHSSKRGILTFIVVYYTFQLIYGWIYDCVDFSSGYSFISFIGLYVIARYIRIHGISLLKRTPQQLSIYFLGGNYRIAIDTGMPCVPQCGCQLHCGQT